MPGIELSTATCIRVVQEEVSTDLSVPSWLSNTTVNTLIASDIVVAHCWNSPITKALADVHANWKPLKAADCVVHVSYRLAKQLQAVNAGHKLLHEALHL